MSWRSKDALVFCTDMKKVLLGVVILSALAMAIPGVAVEAAVPALVGRVNEAFVATWGRLPNPAESTYWIARVASGEKKTYEALVGAMAYQKARGSTMAAKSSAPASAKATADKSTAKATASAKKQMIIDVLPLFIEIFGNNPSEAEKAWWRKRISCDELRSREALINSMKFHKAKNVRKGKNTICGQAGEAAPSGVTSRPIAGLGGGHIHGDVVRVGIYGTKGSGSISVTANGQFQVRGGSETLATLGKDDVVKVSWSGGQYHIRGSGLEIDTDQPVRIVPLSGAIAQITSYSDPSKTIPGKNYNRFRGIVEVRKCSCDELWAINELRTELYLRGLAETSGEGPEEYIKALGVAARTYVLYHKAVTGGRNHARGYDIGSTADDQIYRGYEYEAITSRMASLFNSVRGIIVTNSEGDVPVSTVYFSDSDGRTRSAKEVWNTDRFPHLQHSVEDPHHVSKTCLGHCVGMSAQGAYGFANKDGWNWQRILKYYYKDVKFVKAY